MILLQDLVCKTFYEFWFEEPSGWQNRTFKDNSSVPLEVTKKTEQVAETLRRMSSHQPLAIVIKRILALDFFPQSAKAAGINPVLLSSVRRRCELMCKCLLEKALQVLVSQKCFIDVTHFCSLYKKYFSAYHCFVVPGLLVYLCEDH